MQIEIWSVGKQNESFIDEGIQYYFKKIKSYATVSLHILTPKKTFQDAQQNLMHEEALVLKKWTDKHFVILMDERGRKMNSVVWSQQIQNAMNAGVKTLVFLIGGAFGVSDVIKQKADAIWSFSDLVFPHQLVRLMLAEQIYRSYAILNHLPYHHA